MPRTFPTIWAFEKADTVRMAKQTFFDIDQAYKELLDNDARSRKNFHAFISHTYPSVFIQVIEAFSNHWPLDHEPIVHNFLV